MFPNLKSKEGLEPLTDWATTFWAATASVLPNDPWSIKSKEERTQQRQESLAVTALVFQALGMLAHEFYLESVAEEDLVQWLRRLQEIDWHRENALWRERGVTQVGAKGEPIISNTKTTVDLCHKVLREFVGIAPASGVI